MSEVRELFAASIQGTERALCDELRELGFASVRFNRSGIPFRGTWEDGWRACLHRHGAQRTVDLLPCIHVASGLACIPISIVAANRILTLTRGVLWRRIDLVDLLRKYGTAGGTFHGLWLPAQPYLPGFLV